jgi:hypothetical protein
MIFHAENSFSRNACRINRVEEIGEQLADGVQVERMSLYCICGQVLDVGLILPMKKDLRLLTWFHA